MGVGVVYYSEVRRERDPFLVYVRQSADRLTFNHPPVVHEHAIHRFRIAMLTAPQTVLRLRYPLASHVPGLRRHEGAEVGDTIVIHC